MSETVLPEFVKGFIEGDEMEKLGKKLKDRCKKQLIGFLDAGAEFPGIQYSSWTVPSFEKEDVFLTWAYDNLPKDIYDSLFVRKFDPDQAVALMQQGVIKRHLLPEGCFINKPVSRIVVTANRGKV